MTINFDLNDEVLFVVVKFDLAVVISLLEEIGKEVASSSSYSLL